MRDRRPVWAIPEWAVEEIGAALPPGWEYRVIRGYADGSGDGKALVKEETLTALPGARVYLGFGIPAEVLRVGRELEWVHSGAAGVGSSLTPEMLESSVAFTNSAGIHGPPMAETVVGMVLHFARGLDLAVAGKGRGRWEDGPFLAEDSPVREVAGSTAGVVGFGGIGREVARRLSALGVRILAVKRRHPAPNEAPPGTEILWGEEGLARVVRESDWLILTLPDTPATRGLLGRERLAGMKKGAVLVNVGRGSLVDEEALAELLAAGHLRGAGLDVTRTEPLPRESPLWKLPNVIITPHVSAVTRGFWRRQTDLVVENLRRYRAGEELLNLVDRRAGY